MSENIKNIIGVVLFLVILWGLHGLIVGEGFFGAIYLQLYAIGELVSIVIKFAIIIGIIWLILFLFSKNKLYGTINLCKL